MVEHIIKTYITGGYAEGIPEYGEICEFNTNKVLSICDPNVSMKNCARICARKYGWKYLRAYKDRKYEGMILLFEANLIGYDLGLLHAVSEHNKTFGNNFREDYLGVHKNWLKSLYHGEVGFTSDYDFERRLNKLMWCGYIEREYNSEGTACYKITEKAKQVFEGLR